MLAWQVSSPPPEENFAEIPRVVGNPFGYGVEGSVHAIMSTETTKEEAKNE